MSTDQPNYPLHGITLEKLVTQLVDHLFQKGPQHQIEPQVSAQNAVGQKKGRDPVPANKIS